VGWISCPKRTWLCQSAYTFQKKKLSNYHMWYRWRSS